MSRSAIALLLVLDVVAVVAVVRYLVRWWRGGAVGPAAAPTDEATGAGAEAPAAAAVPVPPAVPTLTVLPRVAFVPPPRRERASVRGLLSTA